MKPLKPSHRENKRYLLIKGKDAYLKNIEQAILEFVGVLGFAEAVPTAVKASRDCIILSINRNSLDKVRASFLMSGKDMRIVKVSGSVGKIA